MQANAQHNTGWYQWRDATIVEPLWVPSTANHTSFAGPGLLCMQQLPGGTGERAFSSGAAVAVRCASHCSHLWACRAFSAARGGNRRKKGHRIGGRGSERVVESRGGVYRAARRLQNSRKPLRAQRSSRNFVQQQWRHGVVVNLRAFLVWSATRLRSAVALRRAVGRLTPCTQHALHCKPEAISAPHERAKKSKNPVQFTSP